MQNLHFTEDNYVYKYRSKYNMETCTVIAHKCEYNMIFALNIDLRQVLNGDITYLY